MSRSRNIKPGFFKNEDLSDMTPHTRLLFIGLWTLADREGRMEYRPRKIVAELFPYEQFMLEPCITHLWSKHFLTVFYADGKRYLQVNNWLKHQAPHHKEVASVIKPADPENIVANQEDFDAWLMHEPCTDHAQFKQIASSPLIPDSGFRIPDSLQETCASSSDEAPKRNDPIPYQAIADAFNANLEKLPKVRSLTTKRRTLIRTAWQANEEHRTKEFWSAYFEECATDPFLSGVGPYKNGHENWLPSFDYLLRADVVTRVYEKAMDRMERGA